MRRPLAVLIGLVVPAMALTACSGRGSSAPAADPTPSLSSSPASSTTPTPTPQPDPPPPAHACYRLGYDAALAPTNTLEPVHCSGTHSAITFFVGHFAKGVPVDGPQVHRTESRACPRRFASFVGGSLEDRRLSLLRTVWFSPTVEQAALGARWFQCVAIALRGDQHLALLDVPVQGALDTDAGRGHYGLCATDQPGAPDFEQRICSRPHSWRSLRTVGFRAGGYPGIDTVKAAGQTPCQDAARAVATDPLNYQWAYAWPTKAQWKAGQTYGVCWAPA
ncbi:MAG: septum formation family protein [Nocardioides sp.]